MKKELLFGMVVIFMACQPEKDITPDSASLSAELRGTYQTNSFLDFRCIALPPDKMPTVDVKTQTDSQITITLRQYFPDKQNTTLKSVVLTRQPDSSIQLTHDGQAIGSFQQDRIFTSSGMETSGKVLRLNKTGTTPLYFVGNK